MAEKLQYLLIPCKNFNFFHFRIFEHWKKFEYFQKNFEHIILKYFNYNNKYNFKDNIYFLYIFEISKIGIIVIFEISAIIRELKMYSMTMPKYPLTQKIPIKIIWFLHHFL